MHNFITMIVMFAITIATIELCIDGLCFFHDENAKM